MGSLGFRFVAILTLLVLAFGSAAAQSPPSMAPIPDRELVIGTKEAPPFAMKRPDGQWYGISIDLWRHIADRLHLRFRFSEQPTIDALVSGTAKGEFDAAVAAITVTAARERIMEFTQPFYATGLGIAAPISENKWMSISRAFMSFGFFQAVLTLVGIAVGIGFLIWLFERRKTEHFGGGAKGLGSGLWWSAVAMTQAGAAQDAPQTLPGRMLAVVWMIASVVTIAVFTAGVTSALTKRELQGSIQNVNDLHTVRVGAVKGTATIDYLDGQRISHRGFASPQDGLKALQTGRIDAFVYDKPLLTWIVLQDFSATLRVLDITFDSQNYAIALPPNSPVRRAINVALLEEIQSNWWQQTLFQYLGKARSS
jgi:ABC-type amino acid transport substrate-binding protein